MRIALLGSINPLDFKLSLDTQKLIEKIDFIRSTPVVDLAESLTLMGHEITVIGSLNAISKIVKISTESGIDLIFTPARRFEKLKAITFYRVERRRIVEVLNLIEPDVVHAHWTYEYALAAEQSKYPYLITVHDAPWEILKDFRNLFFFLRYLMAIQVRRKSSNSLTYVSDYIREKWMRQMYSSEGRVIPNMIRTTRARDNLDKDTLHIISVGNANRGKNVDTLLKAWRIVKVIKPELVLHLVGPGLGTKDKLAKKFKEYQSDFSVQWHGQLSRGELEVLYEKCGILVHPSMHESFGLIFLEAFLFELAIIAFRSSGGAAEVVQEAGILLEENDAEVLAEAILILASNTNLAKTLVCKGQERLKMYSSKKVTQMYLSEYYRTMDVR